MPLWIDQASTNVALLVHQVSPRNAQDRRSGRSRYPSVPVFGSPGVGRMEGGRSLLQLSDHRVNLVCEGQNRRCLILAMATPASRPDRVSGFSPLSIGQELGLA